MKKVLIDVTSTIPRNNSYISGIGKSTYGLIDALNKIPQNKIPFEIELLAVGIKSLNFNFHNWRFKHHIIPIPKSFVIGNTNLPCIWRNLFIKYDIFHIPGIIDYVSKGECFTSVFHDLDRFSITSNKKEKQQYYKISKTCKSIVCCSNFSKIEVFEKLNVDIDKIKVIYWGCDRKLFRIVHEDSIQLTLKKYDIWKPYFFACSCSNPRKNIDTALKAYRAFIESYPKHNHSFVIAWGNPRKEIIEEYNKEITSGKIIFLPYINDKELVDLYNGASMSIYVSRKEGFGFPILESFACGTPVMTCRNSCLEEVGKDCAIYVGEDDIDGMKEIMLSFEENRYDYNNFINRSQHILNQFSWEKCAFEYIDFFSKSLELY